MPALQKTYYRYNIPVVVLVLLCAAACAKRPPRGPEEEPRRYGHEPYRGGRAPRLKEPIIRIGLATDAKSKSFMSDGEIYFADSSASRRVSSRLTAGLSFLANVQTRYFIQVGSFSSRENAVQAESTLRGRTRQASSIIQNRDMNLYQLRVGPFSSKDRAQQEIENLKSNGYPNAFYVEEASTTAANLPDLVLSDETGNVVLKTREPVDIWTDRESIGIEPTNYRGYARVFVNRNGRLTIVNVVNFEDYLKGVIPNEIGPASNSTYEALKAQAVAARTYAYRNLNQFDSEGYDICATPRCQVYEGMKNENVLTSRSAEETRGEVVTYQGEPINALYTSTCGGRTEDAQYMFEGWNYPYLRSVECYPEETESTRTNVRIRGAMQPWWLSWLVVKTQIPLPGEVDAPLLPAEVERDVGLVLTYLGKTRCNDERVYRTDWIHIGTYLVSQLCWQAKRDSLLNEKDYQYFLNHLEFSIDRSNDTHSFLFLFHDNILVPQNLSHFNSYSSMKRMEFLQALYAILAHYHQVNSLNGQAREITQRQLQIVDDVGVHMYDFSDRLYLYQKIGETISPRDEVVCASGDSVEYYLEDNQIRILVCELNQAGVAFDRSSKYTFWTDNVTPEELGRRVAKYLDAGDILDLQPLSYGNSKRLYELRVIGSKTTGVLRGIRIRWALGLKDNLFVIDRVYDRNGRVKQFVFTGRGWGHGLGMCQVGAIGYAREGKDYRTILQHYYTGVQITRVY